MSEYIIPPMTDVGPVTKIEHVDNGYKATIGYTAQTIDDMVLRINEKLDEELIARLAEQHGYKRVVRCRDCRYYHSYQDLCERLRPGMVVMGDGFCAWAVRKEGGDD